LSGKATGSDEVRVYLGAGSNIEPEANLALACRELTGIYGSLSLSSVYRTRAVGFDGDDFLNMVVSFVTAESPRDILRRLDRIHVRAGRQKSGQRYASRTLDLDILLYGDQEISEPDLRIPREDVKRYGFVLAPLAELAPDLRHPQTGERMADLWAECSADQQPLAKQPFSSMTE
jgi:2-amino-4-hydroxy-6-hydroxymethyldihydropteridine diphosphokinase